MGRKRVKRRRAAQIVSLAAYRKELEEARNDSDDLHERAKKLAQAILMSVGDGDTDILLSGLAIALGAVLSCTPEQEDSVMRVVYSTLDQMRARG